MATKPVSLTDTQKAALREFEKISDKIRYLHEQGYSRAEIARALGKRYQHVRNVLVRTETAAEGQGKTTFTVSSAAISALDSSLKDLGLGRDAYLSLVVPDCLDFLKAASANSEETEEILRSYHRPDTEDQVRRGTLIRLSLMLDRQLIEEMNATCASKRIPRDLFMDGVLEASNAALAKAVELLRSPVEYSHSAGKPLCHEYLMNDAEAKALVQKLEEELLLIQAIAQIKNIGYELARESYAALPPDQKSRIREHHEVRSTVARLRSTSANPVVLDDLLLDEG